MVGISFRSPQEGIDSYKQTIELITNIAKNPSEALNSIKELSQQLNLANELSESRKQEACNAQEIIAQSKEFLEDFENAKNDHDKKVKSDLEEVAAAKSSLHSEMSSFVTTKLNTKKELDKIKSDAEEKLATATTLNLAATNLEKSAKSKLAEIASREEANAKAVAEFEKANNEAIAEHETRISQFNESADQLVKDREAFELYKNNILAALNLKA